ncbi:MAG: alpha/beta fold hydrolase [Coriobacteriales bacterium]|nr:alpha/beta fold hydrolase [Coriobacteriales bacterium]
MAKYLDINENGCSIRCKLYCTDPRAVRRVIVFCHGFGGHKDNKAAETFAERAVAKRKGTAVIAFDWPCHGSDARKNLLLEDCDTYLTTVIAYVRERFATDELYAYGTSFGGYLLLKYLSEHGNPFRKVALRCPAINMLGSLMGVVSTEADRELLESGKPVLLGFDRKLKVGPQFVEGLRAADIRERPFFDYAEDILIVHGTADEIVPVEDSARFADDNVIEFVPIEGADHRFRDPKKMDAAIALIISFFGF